MNRKYPDSLTKGVAFLVDMRGWSRANYDATVESAMIRANMTSLPFRHARTVLFEPPLLIRIALPIVKLFLSKKMRQRLLLARSPAELSSHVAPAHVPAALGGPRRLASPLEDAPITAADLEPVRVDAV